MLFCFILLGKLWRVAVARVGKYDGQILPVAYRTIYKKHFDYKTVCVINKAALVEVCASRNSSLNVLMGIM